MRFKICNAAKTTCIISGSPYRIDLDGELHGPEPEVWTVYVTFDAKDQDGTTIWEGDEVIDQLSNKYTIKRGKYGLGYNTNQAPKKFRPIDDEFCARVRVIKRIID